MIAEPAILPPPVTEAAATPTTPSSPIPVAKVKDPSPKTPVKQEHASLSCTKPTRTHARSPYPYPAPRISPSTRSDTPGLQDIVLSLLPLFDKSDFDSLLKIKVPAQKVVGVLLAS